MKFEHIILTKFNTLPAKGHMIYDDPKEANRWMEYRMPMFLETKKSVLRQKNDFKWIISLDERTPKRFIDVIATDRRIQITHREAMYAMEDYKPTADWVVTSRIDCDDQYFPNFTRAIKGKFEPKIKVIDVGFYVMDWWTKKIYAGKSINGSMFVSLIEPADRILTVFCRSHWKLKDYPMSGTFGNFSDLTPIPFEKVNKPLALIVCHGDNLANKVTGTYYCDYKDIFRNLRNS